jgi:hypothetical protein
VFSQKFSNTEKGFCIILFLFQKYKTSKNWFEKVAVPTLMQQPNLYCNQPIIGQKKLALFGPQRLLAINRKTFVVPKPQQ